MEKQLIDISNTLLTTERLILRPFCENDLEDLYEYASVPGVGEMAGWKHHESIEVSRQLLNGFIKEKEVLALVHKERGKVIGSLGIHAGNTPKIKEIGYVLSRDAWGQGLMPEAVCEVIRYCFDELMLDALTVRQDAWHSIACFSDIESRTSQSLSVIDGFRQSVRQMLDECFYILYRDAWQKRQSKGG